MIPLLLLAAFGQPVDEWRTLNVDPRYEVRGHMEPSGIFRYQPATKRARAMKPTPKPLPPVMTPPLLAAPSLIPNFGVNLPVLDPMPSAGDFEVRGNDQALGRALADAAMNVGAAPCPPDGPCPNRPKPRPEPLPIPPVPVHLENMMLIWVLVGLLALFFGVFILALKIVIIFLVCRWIYRKLTENNRPSTP